MFCYKKEHKTGDCPKPRCAFCRKLGHHELVCMSRWIDPELSYVPKSMPYLPTVDFSYKYK